MLYIEKIKNNIISMNLERTFSYTKSLIVKKNAIKVMALTLVATVALFILFFKAPVFTTRVGAESIHIKGVGAETLRIMNVLGNHALEPSYISEIKRTGFDVTGSLIALKGDNIQVYEYESAIHAQNDAKEFLDSQNSDYWKAHTHIYVKSNTVVFYFGTRERILSTLDEVMAQQEKKSIISMPEATITNLN